ncbi:MAG: DoxX family protein [Terriglobia bacterium]
MLTRLFETDGDKALAAARMILGLLFFVRGAQGLLGWFGGAGILDVNSLLRLVSLSAPLVIAAALISFFGGIGLIAGLFARIATVLVVADTAFSIILGLIDPRLFLDWSITQGGSGIEYYSLALALALILAAKDAGAFSLDRLLFFRSFRRDEGRLTNPIAVREGDLADQPAVEDGRLSHVHPRSLPNRANEEKYRTSSNAGRVPW